MSEIKPCPFCGVEPPDEGRRIPAPDATINNPNTVAAVAHPYNGCLISGFTFAVNVWNFRPSPSPSSPKAEAQGAVAWRAWGSPWSNKPENQYWYYWDECPETIPDSKDFTKFQPLYPAPVEAVDAEAAAREICKYFSPNGTGYSAWGKDIAAIIRRAAYGHSGEGEK